MKKCLIVSGGEYSFMENAGKYDFVIACDRGYENCLKMDIKPDVVIGDFDSYNGTIDRDIQVQTLDPVKDDTDTMSAVKYAFEAGYRNIDICCAFGGRFDHSVANIQTAAYILNNGGEPSVFGKGTEVYGIRNGKISLKRRQNSYLSVFSVSDVCRGVSISGTKYELADAELTNSFPLGVSNEWTEESADIAVKDGMVVIIISENVRAD
jgi:thiamine pyrophosphokinase